MHAALHVSPQRRAGAKGYGLFAEVPIRAGQFIIEYVGEVLEEEEYQKRKDFYLASGTRHYYFMNIGNGEVIDACRKVCTLTTLTTLIMSAGRLGPLYQPLVRPQLRNAKVDRARGARHRPLCPPRHCRGRGAHL